MTLAHYTRHDPIEPSALLVPGGPTPITSKYSLLAGNLKAGAVLGRVLGTPVVTAAPTNTAGSGTIGAVTLGAGAQYGRYTVRCVEPASNAGTFELEDPQGRYVGRVTAGAAFTGQLNFTIADATDFVSGDHFFIDVPYAGADGNQVRLAVAAATDGSQTAELVLIHDADASEGAVDVICYERADVMAAALSFGAGHTVATTRESLRARGITIIPTAT